MQGNKYRCYKCKKIVRINSVQKVITKKCNGEFARYYLIRRPV